MPDLIFENSRLVSVYDGFDNDRSDLEHYISLITKLRVRSVLDIGCGTGCLASILAGKGFDVIGVEPAKASLDYARKKPNAEKVRWILGDAAPCNDRLAKVVAPKSYFPRAYNMLSRSSRDPQTRKHSTKINQRTQKKCFMKTKREGKPLNVRKSNLSKMPK